VAAALEPTLRSLPFSTLAIRWHGGPLSRLKARLFMWTTNMLVRQGTN